MKNIISTSLTIILKDGGFIKVTWRHAKGLCNHEPWWQPMRWIGFKCLYIIFSFKVPTSCWPIMSYEIFDISYCWFSSSYLSKLFFLSSTSSPNLDSIIVFSMVSWCCANLTTFCYTCSSVVTIIRSYICMPLMYTTFGTIDNVLFFWKKLTKIPMVSPPSQLIGIEKYTKVIN
jgi:hypothetical protein